MTTHANAAMRAILQRLPVDIDVLDPELAAYVAEGIALEADGSIVAVAAAKAPHTGRDAFPDRVAYEAFINQLHINDASERLATASLEEKLDHALLLADAVGSRAPHPIAVILSVDLATADVVFRFHGLRPGEASWLADLDGYAEPILVRRYQITAGRTSRSPR